MRLLAIVLLLAAAAACGKGAERTDRCGQYWRRGETCMDLGVVERCCECLVEAACTTDVDACVAGFDDDRDLEIDSADRCGDACEDSCWFVVFTKG